MNYNATGGEDFHFGKSTDFTDQKVQY